MMNRIVRILDVLSSNKKIKINMFAELLDISQATLRKDLDYLEKRGIICRTHGYASLDGADDTGKRLAFNYSIKRRIAKAAVQTIDDRETVLVESGSCCALFAEELILARKNVTIITNSVFLVNYVCKMQGIKIILLGGYVQPESQVMIGQMTLSLAENLFIDKYFLGVNGFIPGWGFTGDDHLCVETASALAKYAKHVYILTESAKFNRCGAYSLIQMGKLSGVFTDDNIPKEAETSLAQNNVIVNKVPAVEERIRWRKFPDLPPFLYKEKVE